MNPVLKKKYIRISAITLIVIIGIIGYSMEYRRSARLNRDMTRAFDLIAMQSALERYFIDHHAYPKAEKPLDAQGITTCSEEWASLGKTVGISLPRDPAHNCSTRFYAYRSDGVEYKIIAFPETCARSTAQTLIDPIRPCSSESGAWMLSTPAATQW